MLKTRHAIALLLALAGTLPSGCETLQQTETAAERTTGILHQIDRLGTRLSGLLRTAGETVDPPRELPLPSASTAPSPEAPEVAPNISRRTNTATPSSSTPAGTALPQGARIGAEGSVATQILQIAPRSDSRYFPLHAAERSFQMQEQLSIDDDGTVWTLLAFSGGNGRERSGRRPLSQASYADGQWTQSEYAEGDNPSHITDLVAGFAVHALERLDFAVRRTGPDGATETIIRRGDPMLGRPGHVVFHASVIAALPNGLAVLSLGHGPAAVGAVVQDELVVRLPDGRLIGGADLASLMNAPPEQKILRGAQPFSLSPQGIILWKGLWDQNAAGSPGFRTNPALLRNDGSIVIPEQRWLLNSGRRNATQLAAGPARHEHYTAPDGWVWHPGSSDLYGTNADGRRVAVSLPGYTVHDATAASHPNKLASVFAVRHSDNAPVVVDIAESGAITERLVIPSRGAPVPGYQGFVFTGRNAWPVVRGPGRFVFQGTIAENRMDPKIKGNALFAVVGDQLRPLLAPGMLLSGGDLDGATVLSIQQPRASRSGNTLLVSISVSNSEIPAQLLVTVPSEF